MPSLPDSVPFRRPALRRHHVQKSPNTISVHYTQTIEDRPVFERSLVINVSPNGFVKSVNNDLAKVTDVRRSNLTEGPIVQSAMKALSERAGLPSSLQAHSKVERGYIVHGSTATEVFDVHVSQAHERTREGQSRWNDRARPIHHEPNDSLGRQT